MEFTFHPEAAEELLASIDYYESCSAGLGHDFAFEVHSTIALVVAHPRAWSIVENGIRRCLVHRFPFAILYEALDGHVVVLAVMDLRRGPSYWKERRGASDH